jgi:hypothetical protein
MEFITKNVKIVLAVVVVFILAFVAYAYLTKDSAEEGAGGLSSEEVSIQNEVGKQIFATLALIDSLKLDRSMFEGPVYASLRDLTTEISPEPVGRENPFAPIRVAPATPARR